MKYNTSPLLLLLILLICHTTAVGQPNPYKKKKGTESDWPISYSLKGSPYFGVAPVVETATGTVRSFAIGELLREYPLQLNGQSLPVALVNHYFEAPYSVAGYIENGKARLKIYVNGKRIAEEYCRDDMFEILMVISRAIDAQIDLPKKSTSISIDEGSQEKIPEKSINQLLPGQLFCRVPEDTIINIFKQLQSIETYKVDDLYEEAKFVKGRFGPIDESDINFFKWREIPNTLKDVARKLVFPASATMGPSLSYISIGHQLHIRGDAHGAFHCYLGAIGASKDLLASPYESGALRYVAFRELAKIYEGPHEGRKKTAELLRMVSTAHLAYLNDPAAKKERVEYYNSIIDIAVKLQEAELEAQTQRTTRTFSMINNGLTAATSITAAATGNQQAATAFLNETQKGLNKQLEQDRITKDQLLKKYHEYDKKVIASTFRMDDGMSFDQGKPITPGEIAYLLIKSPETTQRVLNTFISDKPKLRILLANYFKNRTDENLEPLFQYFNDYESKVVNYECRGLAIPSKIIAEF